MPASPTRVEDGGRAPAEDPAPRRDGRGELARLRRRHPGATAIWRRCRSPTASRPSMSSSPSTMRRPFSRKLRNAGAVFLGRHTPEVIGDYVGGSNHVLPTARSARFSSGLSVLDFMKRTSLLKLGPEQLRAARAGGYRSGEGRRAGGAWALRRDPAQPVSARMAEPSRPTSRLIDVELDEIDRPLDARYRARARRRDLRPDRGEQFPAGQRSGRRPLQAQAVADRSSGWCLPCRARTGGRWSPTSCR